MKSQYIFLATIHYSAIGDFQTAQKELDDFNRQVCVKKNTFHRTLERKVPNMYAHHHSGIQASYNGAGFLNISQVYELEPANRTT